MAKSKLKVNSNRNFSPNTKFGEGSGASKVGKKESLKPQHMVFIKEYITTWKAGASAKKAGFHPSYSSFLLKDPRIQGEIMNILESNSYKINVTHKDLLSHLKEWYESDITETIGLSPEQLKSLPASIRRLISNYKHKKTTLQDGSQIETIELNFVSKEKAIEMVAKHIGFFREDNIQNQTNIQINNLSDSALDELMNATEE